MEDLEIPSEQQQSLTLQDHQPVGLLRNRGYKAEILAFALGFLFFSVAFVFSPKQHHTHNSQGILVQVGLLLWLGMCFVLAEIIRRVCLFVEEIDHLKTRYDGSISRIVLHVFNFRNSANFVTVIILLALLFISSSDPIVMTEISAHWPISFGAGGLYLILIAVVKLTENLVDCDVLLDERVMAIGHGLAYSYFYGFLKIILPATENGSNIRERASHFEFEEKIELASKKMLILIPDSCFCTPSFQDMAPCGQIERVKKLEDVIVCRAGMKGRPYSAYIYRIQPEGKKIPVYVMMEMPSILYVLFEMNTIGHQNSKLTAFERTQQAQAFYRVLNRLLHGDPSCKGMFEIIYYKDQNVNLAEMIYNHVQITKE